MVQVARLVCICVCDADRGSARSSPRRRRSSAPHLNYSSFLLLPNTKGRHLPPFCIWSKWRDSNSRHPAPKAGALPTALHLDVKLLLVEAGALPVVVPGIFVGDEAPSSSADHGHSLSSLFPPPAAVASLPNCATPGYQLHIIHEEFGKSNLKLLQEPGMHSIPGF